MNKKYVTVPIAALLTVGLIGCGNSEGANEARFTNQSQTMGNRGNATIYNDNNGPLIQMMNESFGNHERDHRRILNQRDESGNPGSPSKPLAAYDQSFLKRDNRFSRGDANYHGHLDDNTRQARSSYFTAYEGELAETISDVTGSVENVEDVRAVVYGSNVLVAVDLADESREVETTSAIRRAVQPYLRGRTCTVVTDEGTFSRVRNIDNDMRDGGPREQINMDVRNMFRLFR